MLIQEHVVLGEITLTGKYIILLLPELAAALYLAFSFDVGHRRCNFQSEHNLAIF